jgi:rhodanese-related sulfurtransferase
MGYAFGAILAGIVADAFGLSAATYTIAVLTFASGVVVAVRMRETLRKSLPAETCIEPFELDSGALVIDVREPEEFDSGHIEGSINIPVDKLRERIMEIKHHGLVVTACGKGGGRSDRAAQLLRDAGFKDSKTLCGGTNAWFDYTKDLT